jgi:hypothetical protein
MPGISENIEKVLTYFSIEVKVHKGTHTLVKGIDVFGNQIGLDLTWLFHFLLCLQITTGLLQF